MTADVALKTKYLIAIVPMLQVAKVCNKLMSQPFFVDNE